MKEIIGKMPKKAEKQCFSLDGNGTGIILANGFSADTFKCVGKMPDVNQKKGKWSCWIIEKC